MLTDSAGNDVNQAIFQLAYETIHILAPTGGRCANVLEEGLATAFCHRMSPRYGSYMLSGQISYLNAEALFNAFESVNPDGVRQIRAEQPAFVKFTPELMAEYVRRPR